MTAETPVGRIWFDNTHPALRHAWHPICSVAELDAADGLLAVTALGEAWVVARLGDEITVLPDECPHRRAPLSRGRVVDEQLECGYHGFRFDGRGACVRIPALAVGSPISSRASVSAAHVEVRYELVWFAVEDPVTPIPSVPEFDDPTFVSVAVQPQTWRTSAAQLADNFLDVAHFPFVHLGTIGDPNDLVVHPYDVVRDGWTSRVVHRHTAKALADSVEPTDDYATGERAMIFECTAPHHVYLRIEYLLEGVVLVITFFHLPVDAEYSRLYIYNIRNDIADGRCSPQATIDFQLAVGAEDRVILEAIRPKSVSIGPSGEFHSKADRTTVELRRLLADLVDHTQRLTR